MGNGCCRNRQNPDECSSLDAISPYVNPDAEIIRLFLIGCGEVGKSTLVKQMLKLCIGKDSFRNYAYFDHTWTHYQVPFAEEDRMSYKVKIYQNVYRMVATLINAAQNFDLHFDSTENETIANQLMAYVGEVESLYHRQDVDLDSTRSEQIWRLWGTDSAIAGAWNRRREFLVSDSTEYFLRREKLEEMAATGYIPTAEDVLKCRDPTTKPQDYNFLVHKVRFSIKDMGGQRVDWTRLPVYLTAWLNQARPRDRNYVLYVAALSDYNQRRRSGGKGRSWTSLSSSSKSS